MLCTLSNDKSYTEQRLLQNAAAGNSKAFTELYNLYSDKLYSFSLRLTESPELAQDIVQNVFLKLWKDKTQLRDVENFNSYVYRMARNQALNAFKRMTNETIILARIQRELEVYEMNAEENMHYKEVESLLTSVVKELPPQQNLVYKLSKEQGLKNNEIALLLKISPYSVKNHLAVALQTIRECLRNYRNAETMILIIFFSLFS